MWIFAGMKMATVRMIPIKSAYRDRYAHFHKLNDLASGKAHLYY
ncbi:hypothetical protein ALO_01394 [Acetonema longum DSM 6540]|uniref:Uncharacterized protein n=1 Tax=Acetonema longum DSM 6540 TaxID=1009370 RepID=F7NE16_9FIRM|nr:hypothetical protein ALO_01394 [Acetonema longum DSM 6540]